MLTLAIQLKPEFADTNFAPEETGYWLPAMRATAIAVQQMNVLFAAELVDGLIPSNPDAEQIELMLGDVCSLPSPEGVVVVTITGLTRLKIPYLPEGLPFTLYVGEASEKRQVGTDEQGNPVYETVPPPKISGQG